MDGVFVILQPRSFPLLHHDFRLLSMSGGCSPEFFCLVLALQCNTHVDSWERPSCFGMLCSFEMFFNSLSPCPWNDS